MLLHTCTNTSFEGRNGSSQVKSGVVEDHIFILNTYRKTHEQ